jgi:hypothetical protein
MYHHLKSWRKEIPRHGYIATITVYFHVMDIIVAGYFPCIAMESIGKEIRVTANDL